jgi:hypothetical protein
MVVQAAPVVVPALVRGAGALASRARAASPYIQTAVVGAVAVGGAFAISDAVNLYSSRRNMAGQYQEQQEFPNDLTGVTPFYMSFLFQAYEKRSINNSPFLRSEGTIRLPIPDSLKDSTTVTYSEKSLGLAAGGALEEIAKGRGEGGNTLTSIGRAITTALGATAITAGENLVNTYLGGGTGQAVRAYAGITTNPFQTILFEKPNFKIHSFTWKLTPKDANESNTIRNIIRTFQYHMLPGVSEGPGLFFSFPSMVTISLFPSSEFLYRFKPCVIDNVTVNYSPGSTPSFYRGTGAPTAVTITISLKEIEYFTNKDFTAEQFSDTNALGNSLLSAGNRTMLSAGSGENNRVEGQGQGQ